MKIKILDKFLFIFDDSENSIEVSKEDLLELGKTKYFDVKNNCIVDYEGSIEKQKEDNRLNIIKLTKQLENTDYIANKLIEAETDEERQQLRIHYATQLANRKQWRKEISDLQDKIKTLEQEV